jgi:hypothetical protein
MKNIKKITIGLLFISIVALSVIQSNERYSLEVDLHNLMSFNQAQTEAATSCKWGYRKWNCGSWYADSVDCGCNDRQQSCTKC